MVAQRVPVAVAFHNAWSGVPRTRRKRKSHEVALDSCLHLAAMRVFGVPGRSQFGQRVRLFVRAHPRKRSPSAATTVLHGRRRRFDALAQGRPADQQMTLWHGRPDFTARAGHHPAYRARTRRTTASPSQASCVGLRAGRLPLALVREHHRFAPGVPCHHSGFASPNSRP